jgi:hypothetical protein
MRAFWGKVQPLNDSQLQGVVLAHSTTFTISEKLKVLVRKALAWFEEVGSTLNPTVRANRNAFARRRGAGAADDVATILTPERNVSHSTSKRNYNLSIEVFNATRLTTFMAFHHGSFAVSRRL